MTVKPPSITPGTTAGLLLPSQGAWNIHAITQEAVQWYRDLEGTLGRNYSGYIDSDHTHHAHVLDGTLRLMSRVLTMLPLKSTDGPAGERSYYAVPMAFRDTCERLRQVGCHLMPDSFRPDEIARIASERQAFEIYKFEVRVPSPLVGFSFDGGGSMLDEGVVIDTMVFGVYDGGNALMRGAGKFAEMAKITLFLNPQPVFKVDLCYWASGSHHDIDRY